MTGVRSDWLARTEAAVERLTDDLAAVDVRASSFLLQQFLESLERPPDALHGAVLSTMLMDVCARVVQALHDQNPAVPCGCQATIWSHVGRFAQWREHDPRRAFRDWLDTFFAGVEQAHPIDSAVRAAQIIRRDPSQPWTIETLSAAAAARPAALRRDFQERFGMRPSAYVHLARVTRAVTLLRTSAKVEGVAWDVGYRSKKDLYAALSRWAGATPSELRALSDDECAWLERELRIRCLRAVPSRSAGVRLINPQSRAGGAPGSTGKRASRQ